MGNEQGRPIQDTGAQQGKQEIKYDYESLIVIRGLRKTGKTTLVKRMKAQPFNPAYEPTPGLDAFEISWKTNSGTHVKIRVWDVVEHFLPEKSKTPLPDATTVDTLKRANGLVIVLDSRNEESVDLADQLIGEAPEDLQICVFSNFSDDSDVTPVIPEKLQSQIGRFYFIPGSLKTNQGLVELASWLELPLTAAKRKMYADLFRATDEDLRNLEHEFTSTAKNFQTLEDAKNHLPKFIPAKKPPGQQPPPQPTKPAAAPAPKPRVKSEIMDNDVDDEFWSDGDGDIGEVLTPQQRDEKMRPNPMVQNDPRLAAQQELIRKRMQQEIRDTKEPPRRKPAEAEKPKQKPRVKKEAYWSDDPDEYEEEEPEPEPEPEPQKPVHQHQVKKPRPAVAPKKSGDDGFWNGLGRGPAAAPGRPQVIPRSQLVTPAKKQVTEQAPTPTGLAAATDLFDDIEPKPQQVHTTGQRRRRTAKPQEQQQTSSKPVRRRKQETERQPKPAVGDYDTL